ncbi:MAG: response regulator transcription factor [Candidatus Acidiferrales bacterium]
MEEKTSVTIVSSNRLLRESIARILTQKREFTVVASERPSAEGHPAGRAKAGVWVSDSLKCVVESLGGNPVSCERPGWILVAMQDDPRDFLEAVRHGVLGYVLQEAAAADVIAAVRGVARGEAVCPGRLMRVLFESVSSLKAEARTRRRTPFGLTRREQQLVPLVGRGLTNKEIAAELSVSEQTIKSHIHRILRKVGAEDRSGIRDACEIDRLEA